MFLSTSSAPTIEALSWPPSVGRFRRACRRCELIGRKKACDANDGTCDLLDLLVALIGLLVFHIIPPGPPKAPPRLDGGGRVEGRVWDDLAEGGRFWSLRPVPDDVPVSAGKAVNTPFGLLSSPSSEPMSVIRDEMMLGA